jgi:glycosyltransferase involved in cell wall biosynthesis
VSPPAESGRIPILYLAPWVDFGGSDKGTIDWFRWLDRDRFAPSLVTTQPFPNRRLKEIYPYAEEVWNLPELMAGPGFPRFIFDFIHTRKIRVLHIMNSRLGFELLPDLAALDHLPAVVVQLHVEEPDRSGYVRYVTTRYGNLVDAFSVSSRHLGEAVEAYDVLARKIHVIPTGVDAEREFNPARVAPLDGVREPGKITIISPGRLTPQKDPLLALDAIARVVQRHDHVRLEMIGDGPLESAVRTRIIELGLERVVRVHPPSTALARWYRSADLLLMTSVFEGVPYVIFEALAMGVPVVAPALPGNVEVMGEAGGVLVDPGEGVEGYADAISRLVEDPELRLRIADTARARMIAEFTTREMAARHERLYERLLADRPPPVRPRDTQLPVPVRLVNRPAHGSPLVSIIVPCYDHGLYLPALVDSALAQDYPSLEVIIVDDASTDPRTLEVLERVEREQRVTVLRQERNSGPSVARNRALAAASGRYILPADADNILLEGSVRALVDQLQAAGERVGYIYPRFVFFGNREYEFHPPSYNLFSLLHMNYADTCSLLDRELFDAGLCYPEDIKLGHEDWDLVLTLAKMGVIGQPSHAPVMLYRKHGFTRSDTVEYRRAPFHEEIQGRHPELYGAYEDIGSCGRFKGPGMEIKRRYNPALSIVSLAPFELSSEHGRAVIEGLRAQTCTDVELLAQCERRPRKGGIAVRRIPPGLCSSPRELAQEGLAAARGRYLMVTCAAAELLADRTAVERLVRELWTEPALDAIALAPGGVGESRPFAPLRYVDPEAPAHSVVWRRASREELPEGVMVRSGGTTDSIAKSLTEAGARTRWRLYDGRAERELWGDNEPHGSIALRLEAPVDESACAENRERMERPPGLPSLPASAMPRWQEGWTPPETIPLVRHVSDERRERVVTNDHNHPPGFRKELQLGSIQRFSPPGTTRLIRRDDHYMTVERGSEIRPDDELLGYLEQAPLQMFVGVERVILDDGGETLALTGGRDHVDPHVRERTFLGFIETFPNEPVRPIPFSALALPVLVRLVDHQQRAHRYEAIDPGAELDGSAELSAELGQLATSGSGGRIAVYLDSRGRLTTDSYHPVTPSPTIARTARWAAAPAAWRGFGYRSARARSVARRTVDGSRLLISQHSASRASADPDSRRLVGYLYSEPAENRCELFSAIHPVVGDQFVTHHPIEAGDMGYECVTSLGYVIGSTPLTGRLGGRRALAAWGSRFGLTARPGR